MNLDLPLFESFRSCLLKYCPVIANMMQQPHSNEELQVIFDRLGIKDPSYITLYQLTNGIENDGEYPTNAYDFSGFGVIPTIEHIAELYNYEYPIDWGNTKLQVITNFGGDFLLLETVGENAGKLFLYCPTFGYVDFLPTYYDSMNTMFKTIIACFELGAYKYDSIEMFLETDVDLQFEICRKYNPESEYWKC